MTLLIRFFFQKPKVHQMYTIFKCIDGMLWCSQIISIFITGGVFYYGSRNKETEGNAGLMIARMGIPVIKIAGIPVIKIAVIEDPYHLTSAHYQYLLVLGLSVLSVLILWELMYLELYERTDQRWNPAFECSWGLDYPPECVVYLELLGATLIVLLATLFINIAICRRPTNIRCGNDVDNFGASSRKSLQALKQKLRGNKRNEDVTLYYKFAIDAMEQVRDSRAPSSIPWQKSIPFVIVSCLWSFAMIGMSFVVHADIALDFWSAGKGDVDFTYIRRVISILLSYFIVVIFLRFLMRTMYRLNAMLSKGIPSFPYSIFYVQVTFIFKFQHNIFHISTAFMLMKIPSNPMSFIGKEMPKTEEGMDDDDSDSEGQMKNDKSKSEEQMSAEKGDEDSKEQEEVKNDKSKSEEQKSVENDDDSKEQEEEINFRDLLESWKLDEYANIMESKGWDNPINWKELISDSVYVKDPLKDLGFKEGMSLGHVSGGFNSRAVLN